MNVFSSLLDLILPRECHLCGERLLAHEEFICAPCSEKLPATFYEKYWDNKSGVNTDLNPMEQRFAGQLPLDRACAPFFYTRDSSLSLLVQDFKYRGFSNLAVTLGKLGAQRLKNTELFSGVDVLLPVPLHWSKQMKRGYNQSERLARGVSVATGIPVGKNLKAVKPHRTQTSLNSQQRLENTKGIFKIVEGQSLSGKTVMLVDDICTTGATLLSAGEAIAASVENVRIRIFTLGVV